MLVYQRVYIMVRLPPKSFSQMASSRPSDYLLSRDQRWSQDPKTSSWPCSAAVKKVSAMFTSVICRMCILMILYAVYLYIIYIYIYTLYIYTNTYTVYVYIHNTYIYIYIILYTYIYMWKLHQLLLLTSPSFGQTPSAGAPGKKNPKHSSGRGRWVSSWEYGFLLRTFGICLYRYICVCVLCLYVYVYIVIRIQIASNKVPTTNLLRFLVPLDNACPLIASQAPGDRRWVRRVF